MLGTTVVRVMCLVDSGGCCSLARSRVAEFVRCRVCHANHQPGRSHRLVRTWVVSAIFTGLHAVGARSLMPYCGTWGHSCFFFPAEGTSGLWPLSPVLCWCTWQAAVSYGIASNGAPSLIGYSFHI